ncbi:Hypothetical predicted protein [Cloeon dipterum]|uniref:Pyridoxal kinase n=1 Tax=Cloeon dipterum TaxID=197152 RepID=A0A8S1CQX7_9INSE|nr:Hypothetical predicted protein [Cloeon dipterum]
MATRWSNDFIVAEHKDLQATAMSVDHSGSLVLLFGRRYMALVNLDKPTETLKKVNRKTKYDVGFAATADWSPVISDELIAFSSDERVEVFRWKNCDLTTEHSFKAHSRVVTDLQWHKTDPNLLATCSLDTFLHIWDLRDMRRPATSLSTVVGSSHVRWNCVSKDVLASAHDGDVKIWDHRKPNWNLHSENHITTSSQDCTVKFFDINSPRRVDNVLTFNAPVWRVKHAPFGNGLVTVVISNIRREEKSLVLWNTENQVAPVHTFVGHSDHVLEVAWRKKLTGDDNFQLVTWCKDQRLRIWRIEPSLQELCGHVLNNAVKGSVSENEILTDPVDPQEIVTTAEEPETAEVMSSPIQTPKTLQQEFTLTNSSLANVMVEDMDADARTCIVTAKVNMHIARLLFTFPPSYPVNSPPSFKLLNGSQIDATIQAKLLKDLKQTALQRVKKNKSCLEPCLRILGSSLESLVTVPEDSSFVNKFPDASSVFGSFKDAYVPFPRSSGAAFCSAGLLVCFGQPNNLSRRVSVRSESSSTPRALSALVPATAAFGTMTPLFSQAGSGTGSQVPESQAIASFYYPERQRARSKGRNSGSGPSGHRGSFAKPSNKVFVIIYDSASLLFMHRELAEKYKLKGKDVVEVCHYNAGVALSANRKDLAQVWQLAALAAATPPPPLPLASHWSENDEDSPSAWAAHPFGQTMIEALVQHYAKQCDVQTAAMLSCLFGSRTENLPSHRKKLTNVNVSPGGSPYHTVHPADTSLEGWSFHLLKQNRSNSWSDSLDEIKTLASMSENTDPSRMEEIELSTSKMLDEKNSELHDCFKRVYADILYRWDLLEARTQVLKYVTHNNNTKGMEFITDCRFCSKQSQGPSCLICKETVFPCSICHISVRGPASFCFMCGHGGHIKHMNSWFAKEEQCPTGCGCKCMIEMAGYVGNKSATFPLQVLGFEVDAINSVQFSNHTGYGFWKGQVLNEHELDELTEGLERNELLNYSHLLTGYVGNPLFLSRIVGIVPKLRKVNPSLVFVCDPVMGDNGQMYVPKELMPIYRDQILPLADIITPNQFEAELLTGTKMNNKEEAWEAVRLLHAKGPKTVILSSTELGSEDYLLALASYSDGTKSTRISVEIPKLPAIFTGTGDLFAALILAWMTKSNSDLKGSVEKTISTLQAVLKRTIAHAEEQSGGKPPSKAHLELRLIQSKSDIEQPTISVTAVPN